MGVCQNLYVLTGSSLQGGNGSLTTIWKCKMCGSLIQVLGFCYPQNIRCLNCGAVNLKYPKMHKKTDWSDAID